MGAEHSVFWDDLAEDLKDPEFLREYVTQSVRIATIDRIINALEGALAQTGMTKTALARAISTEPATIRRLLSHSHPNPTLGTLAEVAAGLGMRVTLEPLPANERAQVTDPLLRGESADTEALAHHLEKMRHGSGIAAAR